MTDSEPGADLALRDAGTLTEFIGTYRDDFAAIVPPHINPVAFVGMAAARVRSNRELREATKFDGGQLILALRECAALGHMPERRIWTPVAYKKFKQNNRGKWEHVGWSISGIEEWRGVLERVYRAGAVQSVTIRTVRENDICEWNPDMDRPYHRFDWKLSPADRGPLAAVYVYGTLHTGMQSSCVFLNAHDVAKYRKMSKTADKFWGPEWPAEGPNTEAMWMKTGIHRWSDRVPKSAGYRWEVARAAAAAVEPGRFAGIAAAAVTPLHPEHEPVNPDEPPAVAGPVDAEVVSDGHDWSDVQVAKPADAR